MGSVIKYLLGLKNPSLVANFQKFCQIEILPGTESEKKDSESDYLSSSSHDSHVPNGDLHQRLAKTNGFVQNNSNSVINNEHCSQNGSIHSNNVDHMENVQKDCIQSEDKQETKYIVHSKFLYWTFRLGAGFGNEFFYLTFFTFCLWNLNSLVMRQMVIIWNAGMYLGQAAKDIIEWPRPSSPPCARLENRYLEEYGMPSTHATVGVIIPFGLIIIGHRHYEFDFPLPLIVAFFWATVCGLSRIYLGMHSVLDVIVGAAIGIILIPLMLPYVEALDNFQVTSMYSPLVVVGGEIFLLYIYPNATIWNTAKGDTATVVGIGAGIAVATWLNYQLGFMIPSEVAKPYHIPSLFTIISMIPLAEVRHLIGILVLVITRAVAKPITHKLFCLYYNVDSKDEETQRKIGMEKPQKFVAYFCVGFAAIFIVPNLLRPLGLMRMSFYTEM
ncbi:sphingosine-1-phosphate phosphatase 2-like [Mytilus edulis]|uniref:sphingosine-1-phosphate phosphatase 2-like n=1 Tax=Mytilus edulis TaxID=6550 RepID=UPI0039F0D074